MKVIEAQSAFDFALEVSAAPGVVATRQPGGGVMLRPGKLEVRGSVKQAAKILGVSPRNVLRMIDEGTIEAWQPRQNGSPNCKFVVNLIPVYEMAEKKGTANGR